MAISSRVAWPRAGWPGLATLAAVLIASIVLMLLPRRATAPLKDAAAEALAPGQRLALGGRQRISRSIQLFNEYWTNAKEHELVAEELRLLRLENADLKTALALAASRVNGSAHDAQTGADTEPLICTELLPIRVLGPQARSFLERLEIVDAGSAAGLQPQSFVVAGTALLLDQGRNAGLEVDDLALAGRRILGRLTEVHSETSVMRRVTDAGYRDLVQLAHGVGEQLRRGARGVLEGTGETLCRIRMVDATEPVSAGDLVLSATEAGINDVELVYGRVERVERRPGDPHWQIWMKPAADQQSPREAAVLRLKLNSVRVARNSNGSRSN